MKKNNEIHRLIDEFNRNYKIQEVIEKVANISMNKKSCCCPLHGGDNNNGATIHLGKNIFSCWTGDCGKAITPWLFIKKYYELESFKDVAIKANELFNANIPVYPKKHQKTSSKAKTMDKYDNVYNVKEFLSEANNSILDDLKQHSKLLLNASTGLGKTFGIHKMIESNPFGDDYVFFLVPTRSIAEQVAKDHPQFALFYGDDCVLPPSKFVVSTYHKIHHLEKAIETEISSRALMGIFPPSYLVIVDEVHELMSKRKLLGNKVRKVESFIKDADRSILMSANTRYINKAYKNFSLFNKYICVKTDNIRYNADKLNIYRIPRKEDQKLQLTVNLIKEKLNKFDRVLFFEDSKDKLQQYAEMLNNMGIDTAVINSETKENDDVIADYKGIIENSKLVKTVTFTTSLINAGVNIKMDKVALICKQDKNAFDMLKLEQFLARIRTKGNDLNVILTQSKEGTEPKNIISSEFVFDNLSLQAQASERSFNMQLFSLYGLDVTEEVLSKYWNNYKRNEAYKQFKDTFYTDDGILRLDVVALTEQARLTTERANYYNNNFILQELDRVKAKEKQVIYIAPVETDKELSLSEEVNITEDIAIIIQDKEVVSELYKLSTKEIKSKDIENEILKEFYEKYNRNKVYKELMSNLRGCLLPVLEEENINKVLIFTQILMLYSEDNKKKFRDTSVQNIKRREIFNKFAPLGCDKEQVELTGDFVYMVIRKNFDCFIGNRHCINERAFNWALSDLIKLRNLTPTDNGFINASGKKIAKKSLIKELDDCTEGIYRITNKGYITELL